MSLVLAINSGSSSVKTALFDADERRVAEREAGRAGDAIGVALSLLEEAKVRRLDAIGHRVVHGGPRHTAPEIVDAALLESLEAAIPLAPLHLPPALDAIRAALRRFPGVPQVACFDTAFHASLPEHARRFALPEHLTGEAVRRYGFHGLSYEYVLSRLGGHVPSRVILAHLGSGASVAAVRDGVSVDTTMGLTPAGGVVMATRPGDLDPGVLVHLARQHRLSPDELDAILNQESGLRALAGTGDMKTILARRERKDDPSAQLAFDVFVHALKKAFGAFVAVLGGLDLLVFTGGIGEHAPAVRSAACEGLEPLGILVDERANARAKGEATISAPSSAATVRVIPTDEDRMIARHTRRVLGLSTSQNASRRTFSGSRPKTRY